MSFLQQIFSLALPSWRNAYVKARKSSLASCQQGIRDGEFDLHRSSSRAADVARIIVSFGAELAA